MVTFSIQGDPGQLFKLRIPAKNFVGVMEHFGFVNVEWSGFMDGRTLQKHIAQTPVGLMLAGGNKKCIDVAGTLDMIAREAERREEKVMWG